MREQICNGSTSAERTKSDSGGLCPACNADIGTWPIVAAGLPNRIRCPGCKARLKYVSAAGVIALAVFATLAPAFMLAAVLRLAGAQEWNFLALGMLLLFWLPTELLTARYLRQHKTLARVSGDLQCDPGDDPVYASIRARRWIVFLSLILAFLLWIGLPVCPYCLWDGDVIRIVYGLPSPKGLARANAGEIKLGGCMVSPGKPTWHCKRCDSDWGRRFFP